MSANTGDDLLVLLLEDADSDARLVLRDLAMRGLTGVTRVRCLADALGLVSAMDYDLVLADLGLPDATGIEVVRALVEAAPDAAVVVLTGRDNDDLALEAARAGAQDFITKATPPASLVRRLHEAVVRSARERDMLACQRGILAAVSHELLGPLGVIAGSLEVLSEGDAGPLGEAPRRFMDVMQRNLMHARSLVQDLLDTEAIETGSLRILPAPFDVARLLAETVDELSVLASGSGVEVVAGIPAGLYEVLADRKRVKQVIGNILMNAIGFTPHGGRVEAHLTELDSMIRVDISDTGPGIPTDEVDVIFDKHRQGSAVRPGRHGVGLGLHVVRELMERLGGDVWVTSVPGEGATFSFTLPLAPAPLVEPDNLFAIGRETRHVSA